MSMEELQGARRKKAQVSKGREDEVPPIIGEGQQPMRGAAASTPFSPLHGGGNSLIK
jgi:hypothetical protein